ncbi:MAG: hypothetical protein ACREKE_03555, partial [bacterium]
IVFALIAVPLADLGSSLRQFRAGLSRLVFLGLLAACIFFSYRSARRLFVDARGMAFDVEPTYIAQVAGNEGGPHTQAVFWGTGFASSHPPMQLLRKDTPLRNFYGPFEWLPITQITGQDQLLFFGDDYERILPYVESLYPRVPVRTIPDPRGGLPIALWLRVDKGAIRASEGLDGTAWIHGKKVPLTGVAPDWPLSGLEGARRVHLAGSLNIDYYGTYGVELSGVGDARVRVDGKLLFSRHSGSVTRRSTLLAKGLHSLELDLEPSSPKDSLRLQLRDVQEGPPSGWALRELGINDVGLNDVLRLPANGFLGSYYTALLPMGKPSFQVVEPVVMDNWLDSPFLGNWCADWRVRFYVDQPGNYRFSVRGGAFSRINVDSRLVWQAGTNPQGSGTPMAAVVRLSKGWHDYDALLSSSGGTPHYELDWTKPDGTGGVFWIPGLKPEF